MKACFLLLARYFTTGGQTEREQEQAMEATYRLLLLLLGLLLLLLLLQNFLVGLLGAVQGLHGFPILSAQLLQIKGSGCGLRGPGMMIREN